MGIYQQKAAIWGLFPIESKPAPAQPVVAEKAIVSEKPAIAEPTVMPIQGQTSAAVKIHPKASVHDYLYPSFKI